MGSCEIFNPLLSVSFVRGSVLGPGAGRGVMGGKDKQT